MNFKPLSNHVFLEPVKAKVIAVGPGKKNDKGELQPMTVKIGDVVLFKKYGPDELELEGKKYLVGDEEDILAIVEEEASQSVGDIAPQPIK
jgi:chaperonin GroES